MWARILVYGGQVLLVVGLYAAAFILIPPHAGFVPVLVGFLASMVLSQPLRRLLRRREEP